MEPTVTLWLPPQQDNQAIFYEVTRRGDKEWEVDTVSKKPDKQNLAMVSGYVNALYKNQKVDKLEYNPIEHFKTLSEKISKKRNHTCFCYHVAYTLQDRMPQSLFQAPDFFEKSLRHRVYLLPKETPWTDKEQRTQAIKYLWEDFLAIFTEGFKLFLELDIRKFIYHPLLRLVSMTRDIAAILYPPALFTVML